MLSLLERHKVQVLAATSKFTLEEVAAAAKVSVSTVQRILAEEPVAHVDDAADRKQRRIGRPSKTKKFEDFVRGTLKDEPHLQSKELLRRAKQDGYGGTKSAFFEMVKAVRPKPVQVQMRFDGLPGEFSQHDFGQVIVRFGNGTTQKVTFFASRLKYSRFVAVTVVPDQTAETLVRAVCEHCKRFGGVPLRSVFDRPRTVASAWHRDGTVTRWNNTFAQACLEIGFLPELCWPYQPRQKGAVESLVGFVKNSFFNHEFRTWILGAVMRGLARHYEQQARRQGGQAPKYAAISARFPCCSAWTARAGSTSIGTSSPPMARGARRTRAWSSCQARH